MIKMSIITIGDCVVDYYPNLDQEFIGGGGLNNAVYLKDKDFDSELMGIIGDDIRGKKILDYLKHKGFDLTRIKVRNGDTALAIIKKVDGDYEIDRVQEGIKKKYRFSREDIKNVKNYDIVHTNIYSHVTHLLPYLKENNDLISFDYSFKVDYERLKELSEYIDILFVSKNNVLKKEFLQLKKYDIDYIILSSGSEGFIIIHKGQEYYKEPVGKYIKDSTGAGDTLIAEVLAGIHENINISDIIDTAAQKAYETCLKIGPYHDSLN